MTLVLSVFPLPSPLYVCFVAESPERSRSGAGISLPLCRSSALTDNDLTPRSLKPMRTHDLRLHFGFTYLYLHSRLVLSPGFLNPTFCFALPIPVISGSHVHVHKSSGTPEWLSHFVLSPLSHTRSAPPFYARRFQPRPQHSGWDKLNDLCIHAYPRFEAIYPDFISTHTHTHAIVVCATNSNTLRGSSRAIIDWWWWYR